MANVNISSTKPENVVADTFAQDLGFNKTQVYSKIGDIPEEVITNAFDIMQKRSLENEIRIHTKPVRIFTFNMNEPIVRNIEGGQFYREFCEQFINFIEQVPEYTSAEHLKPVLERLKGDDFSQVYGDGEFELGEKDIIGCQDPLFKDYHNFAANLTDFLKENFKNPQQFLRNEKFSNDFPSLIPVFNFQWPEVLKGEEAEKAVEALKSYAGKIDYKFGTENGFTALDRHDVTPYEIEMADKNGFMMGFVSRQQMVAGEKGLRQIIATPLYCLEAIPSNPSCESWIKGGLANDLMKKEFSYHGYDTI